MNGYPSFRFVTLWLGAPLLGIALVASAAVWLAEDGGFYLLFFRAVWPAIALFVTGMIAVVIPERHHPWLWLVPAALTAASIGLFIHLYDDQLGDWT